MTKTEINEVLSEIGETEQDLDFMWNFCVTWEHPIISEINNNNPIEKWRSLNKLSVKTLPKEYEKLFIKSLENNEDDIRV